jgi:hypothetical protein
LSCPFQELFQAVKLPAHVLAKADPENKIQSEQAGILVFENYAFSLDSLYYEEM